MQCEREILHEQELKKTSFNEEGIADRFKKRRNEI